MLLDSLEFVVKVIQYKNHNLVKVLYVFVIDVKTGELKYFTVSRIGEVLNTLVAFLQNADAIEDAYSTPIVVQVPKNIANPRKLARMNAFSGLNLTTADYPVPPCVNYTKLMITPSIAITDIPAAVAAYNKIVRRQHAREAFTVKKS